MTRRGVTLLAAGCVLLLLLLLLGLVAAFAFDWKTPTPPCDVYECPNYKAINHYEQLGCTSSDGPDVCCPKRFDCSSLLSLDKTKCHYQGKAYDQGTIIEKEIISTCIPSCKCSGDVEGTFEGEATFDCTIINCPALDDFGTGCKGTYSFDKCCATGLCGDFHQVPRRDYVRCIYNGTTYYDGELIEEVPGCLRCICQDGFNGTLEAPWCEKINCEYTLSRRPSQLASCAPVYWEYLKCCPFLYYCPKSNSTLIRHSPPTGSDEYCSFGDNKLKIGDELQSNNKPCIRCRCDVPPFITCTLISFDKCTT